MIVRLSTADDLLPLADEAKRVAAQSDQLGRRHDGSTPEEVAASYAESIESGATFLVLAEGEGSPPLGMLGLDPDVAVGVLRIGMWVATAAQGRGGGRLLLDAAIAHAREAGARKLALETFTDNARAIALYVSAGFEIEGMKRRHYLRPNGRVRSSLVMGMLLDE